LCKVDAAKELKRMIVNISEKLSARLDNHKRPHLTKDDLIKNNDKG
jgi:hypothetical protein